MSVDPTWTPWRHRSNDLVIDIIEHIVSECDTNGKALWPDVVDRFTTDRHAWKTIENVLYDLCTFGVCQRIGKHAERGRTDTRALVITVLGHAWLEGDIVPTPTRNKETIT